MEDVQFRGREIVASEVEEIFEGEGVLAELGDFGALG